MTASIITELVLSNISSSHTTSTSIGLKHYNLVNPSEGSWSSLVPSITNYLSSTNTNQKLEPVSFQAWLKALQASATQTDEVRKNPAVKILDFYEGMNGGGDEAKLETEQTVASSRVMRDMTAVGPEWMETWLRQWGY